MRTTTRLRPPSALTVALALSLLSFTALTPATRAQFTWSNTASSNPGWSTTSNWTGGSLPTTGATVSLTANLTTDQTISLGADRTVGSLTLGDTGGTLFGYTLTGNTLIFDAPSVSTATYTHTANAGPVTLASALTLTDSLDATIDAGSTSHFSGVVAGTGALTKLGSGTLILSATNTYSGGTTINAGSLQVGSGGTTGSLVGNVLNNATLAFHRSNALSYGGVISGTGTVTVTNGGGAGNFLQLSGNNTYSGGTTLTAGSSILLGHANGLGTGPVTLGANSILFASSQPINLAQFTGTASDGSAIITTSGAYTYDSATSGTVGVRLQGFTSGLTKSGAGTLTLTGANSYSGPTTIAGGTLQLGSGGTSGSLGFDGVSISSGATLAFNRSDAITVANALSGEGSLVKQGSGSLTLSGSNSYTGTTTLSAGRLILGSAGALGTTSRIIMNGGTLQFSAANTTDYSSRFYTNSPTAPHYRIDTGGQSVTFANNLPSGGPTLQSNLTKSGTGSLLLNRGFSSTSGSVSVIAGTLQFGNGGSTFFTTNSLSVTSGAAFIIDHSNDLTHIGTISASGSFTKRGAGNLALSGLNNFASLALADGSLVVNSTSAIGSSGTISFSGGSLKFTSGNSRDYSARFSNSANQLYSFDTNSQSVTFASALTSSGGSLTKLGAGTLTLTAANTYSGTTTISGGTLQIGDGGTAGSLGSGGVVIGSGASLMLNRSDAITVANALSGEGSLVKQGSDSLTLSGSNSYTGTTTLSAGRLILGSASALGTTSRIIMNGGTLQFSAANTTDYSSRFYTNSPTAPHYRIDTGGQSVTFANNLPSGGPTLQSNLTKSGTGSLLLNRGFSSTSGSVSVIAGTLQFGNGGSTFFTTNSLSVTSGAAFIIDHSNDLTHIGTISASGSFTKRGAGNLALSGLNNFASLALADGSLVVNSTSAIGSSGTISFSGGSLKFTSGNSRDYSARFSNSANQLYSFDTNSQSVTFASALSSTGGSLTKLGSGTLTLTAANTYSGTTTISGGTLQLGASASLASSSISVASGATFDVSAAGFTLAAGRTLTGSGSITGALNVAGTLAPGESPGTLAAGNTTFAAGGTYLWEINHATGVAGTNYDLLSISGTLTLAATSANPFTLQIASLLANNSAGPALNFNPAQNYAYTIATTTGGVLGFDASDFTINTTAFANSLNGGSWSLGLTNSNRDLTLSFTAAAIPEPSTYAMLAGLGAFALAAYRRRP